MMSDECRENRKTFIDPIAEGFDCGNQGSHEGEWRITTSDPDQIIGDEVLSLAAVRERSVREVRLRIGEGNLTAERALALDETLKAHPGNVPASIEVMADGFVASVKLSRHRVAPTEKLMDAVERLFGEQVAYLQ